LEARSILTRSSGYLATVCSHSLNPYRGCSYGNSLCGVACYAQFQFQARASGPWGGFLGVKHEAAELYLKSAPRERRWARAQGCFSVFMASSTDPFVPQERSYRISRRILLAMLQEPPDELIVQTHSPLVLDELETLQKLAGLCQLRVHLSIEGDRERLPGLPPPAFSLQRRLNTARQLKAAGLRVVATLAPLHPLGNPAAFFQELGNCVEAVVIDHFIEGDGSRGGARTHRTPLPSAMERVHPGSSRLEYREQVIEWAQQHFPGRIGVGCQGFAGRYLDFSK